VTTVAILGTGRMGGAMARRLASQSFDVHLWNRTPAAAQDLAADIGATAHPTPAAAAADADVVISMLADETAVRAVYEGPDGAIGALQPNAVAVDMSTVLPDTSRALAPAVRARGAGLLDAPVSGSVSLAEAGALTILAGGDAADLDRARPVLDALAGRIFHLGPLGSGATMKLAVNDIVFGLAGAVSEALVLAERSGVDRATAYEVFANSAIAAPLVGYKRDAWVDPDHAPVAFSIDLARKDLRLILELSRRVGAQMPQARVNDDLLAEAAAHVGGDRDFAAVAAHLRTS
jgi:3-hydroxyisobutyrate dehydrogenase-like beta-hydroxyacid dehydrogenase